MTQANRNTAQAFKDMEGGTQAQTAQPSTREGELLKRKRRRRLDLKTLHGTLRESARVYREFAEGRITAGEAEVRSRVLRRHGEILGAVEQQRMIEDLQQKLDAIQSGSARTTTDLLPAPSSEVPL